MACIRANHQIEGKQGDAVTMTTKTMQQLTIEQQLEIQKCKIAVAKMSEQQAKELAVQLFKRLLEQKNGYCELLKKDWGIG